jgi:hypothetical protein
MCESATCRYRGKQHRSERCCCQFGRRGQPGQVHLLTDAFVTRNKSLMQSRPRHGEDYASPRYRRREEGEDARGTFGRPGCARLRRGGSAPHAIKLPAGWFLSSLAEAGTHAVLGNRGAPERQAGHRSLKPTGMSASRARKQGMICGLFDLADAGSCSGTACVPLAMRVTFRRRQCGEMVVSRTASGDRHDSGAGSCVRGRRAR